MVAVVACRCSCDVTVSSAARAFVHCPYFVHIAYFVALLHILLCRDVMTQCCYTLQMHTAMYEPRRQRYHKGKEKQKTAQALKE